MQFGGSFDKVSLFFPPSSSSPCFSSFLFILCRFLINVPTATQDPSLGGIQPLPCSLSLSRLSVASPLLIAAISFVCSLQVNETLCAVQITTIFLLLSL